MISYVNTVFVNNAAAVTVNKDLKTIEKGFDDAESAQNEAAGKFFIIESDDESKVRIGLGKNEAICVAGRAGEHTGKYMPVIKWSNWINKDAIKSIVKTTPVNESQDTVTIDFGKLNADVLNGFHTGKQRIVVRLTFKDLPTRFRKWTESYEYIPKVDDTEKEIAEGIAKVINDQYKRARVIASVETSETDNKKTGAMVKLVAMPYDDDNSVDTINVANKVRFTANIYYTDPQAAGFASKNKYFPTGVVITKTAGKVNPNAGKRVRDREAQAMGYDGILNRGCCTWPIIKPQMETDITKNYNGITIEFENMYRAADDIQRHTKQTVEIYTVGTNDTLFTDIKTALGVA